MKLVLVGLPAAVLPHVMLLHLYCQLSHVAVEMLGVHAMELARLLLPVALLALQRLLVGAQLLRIAPHLCQLLAKVLCCGVCTLLMLPVLGDLLLL